MARRTFVPESLAPEARELLLAFIDWCGRQEGILGDDQWTYPMMVDLFLMEAGANGDMEVNESGEG